MCPRFLSEATERISIKLVLGAYRKCLIHTGLIFNYT